MNPKILKEGNAMMTLNDSGFSVIIICILDVILKKMHVMDNTFQF